MRPRLALLLLLFMAACRPPAKAVKASCPPSPAPSAAEVQPPAGPARPTPPVTFIRGATVWTAAGQVLKEADVLLEGGLIKAVGQGLEAPDGALVLDGKGKHLTPGLIDPHSHIGVYPAPGGLVGHGDGNEVGKPLSPSVRVQDAIWPQDPSLPRALAAGVTALHVIPGSANLVGGEGLVIRPLPGRATKDLRLAAAPRTMKMACGENPKRVYAEKGGPFTRMGNVARIRAAFREAREYARSLKRHEEALKRWKERRKKRCSGEGSARAGEGWQDDQPPAPPKVNHALASLSAVLSGEARVHMHCYRADEISLMLDLARSQGFTIAAFHHATGAYKVRDLLQAAGTGAVVWINWWGFKAEAMDSIPEAAALLSAAGVTAALHSDSALVIQRLNQEAALAYHRGKDAGLKISEDQALQLVTRGPARLLGIDHLTGSIETGKMGDLVLWDGHPFSVFTRTTAVLVEGRLAYQRTRATASRLTDFELATVPRPAPLEAAPITLPEPTLPARWVSSPALIGPPAPVRASAGQHLVIRGATVHTMTGPPIKDGTVVVQGDRITAVGGPEVSSPKGARFISASDLVLTPGLVATETALGLVEITMEPTARDHQPDGKRVAPVRADLRAWEAINPHSTAIPVNRMEGFTTAIVRPFGGLISGQSAAYDLEGLRPEEMGLRGPLGVHVNLGIPGSRASGGSRALAMMHLRRLLDAARDLSRNKRAVNGRRFRELGYPRTQLLPLVPVVEGRIPLVVRVDRAVDILDVMRLAAEQKVRLVLSGAAEGWRVAEDIARAKVPVLVAVDRNLPLSYDALASRYDNAARLHRAGVVLGLSADGQAHNIRFLRQEAGIAAAWGLPRQAALAALTRNPAAIFGLEDRGVLKPGARANLVLWTADPLELSTRVKQLFIAGREVPLVSRQTGLLRRYLKLEGMPGVAPNPVWKK